MIHSYQVKISQRNVHIAISAVSAIIAFLGMVPNVQAGLIFKAPSSISMISGLVGYWSFDESTHGTTSIADLSGNNNRGHLINGPTKAIGKLGQALSFDGVNDYVQTTNTIAKTNAATWAAWVYLNTISGTQTVIMDGATFPEGIQILSTGAVQAVLDGSFADPQGPTLLTAGRWYHIVLTTLSVDKIRVYINGVQDIQYNSGGFDHDCAYTIGARRTCDGVTTSNFLNGLIDDVRIYDRALSGDEIKRLYNLGR